MIALRVTLPLAHEEIAVEALWELNTAGIEVQPASEGRIALLAFFPVEESQFSWLADRLAAQLPQATIEGADVPDVDWVARFRDSFRPFSFGSFRIVPVWDDSEPAGARVLRMDPGRAFGTGTHESTRLCLTLLERLASERSLGRVVDVGTGTGILALAATRLGATFTVALDLDPEATDSCRRHAALNTARLHVVRCDGARALQPRHFDVMLANLTAPLLIERAAELGALFTQAGILAGLLAEDVAAVRTAFAAVDPDPHVECMGEWAGLLLTPTRA